MKRLLKGNLRVNLSFANASGKVQELRDRFAELEKQIETLNNNLEALD